MKAAVLRAGLCLILTAASACGSGTGPVWEASVAQQRWEARRPAAYQYTVLRGCECLPEMIGPVIVFVDGGTVTRRYVATNADVPPTYAELFPTIDGLFELIEEARRQDADRIDVDYDATYGFPTRVSIDYHREMADDEIVYSASQFVIPVR